MENLILTSEQESSLIFKGFTDLPQIKNESISSKEIDRLIASKDKIYTSGTEFHKKYIDKNDIYTRLKKDLKKIAKNYYDKKNLDDTYEITRITKGSQSSESYLGHFDSHLFTLVTPVVIPSTNSEESGQLIIFPKIRKEPKNELINILGKIFFKKYHSKKRFTKLMKKQYFEEFNFKDQTPILFLGRVTLHGNRGFKEDMTAYRITLLTHFFDPSPKYGIGNILRKFRSR
tara:strand:+ start:445 stop:1137 length:693 start_codon:yes stop_codon:yes gene_type:complete